MDAEQTRKERKSENVADCTPLRLRRFKSGSRIMSNETNVGAIIFKRNMYGSP